MRRIATTLTSGRAARGPAAWLAPLVARLYLRRPELEDLIAIKRQSNRPQDQEDALALEALRGTG